MPAAIRRGLDHFAARIKLWAAGLEPNDARLIDSGYRPAPHGPRDVFAYLTTSQVRARSTRARCAPDCPDVPALRTICIALQIFVIIRFI